MPAESNDEVAVSQLVTEVVARAKSVRELIKDTQSHDLKSAVSDLYDGIIDVKVRVLDLLEENEQLRTRVEESGEVIGPTPPYGYYFSSFDVRARHPLCPECMQDQGVRLAFLSFPVSADGGNVRKCDICGSQFFEEEFLIRR